MLKSNRKAQRTEIARRYHVNEFYDVVAPNGLVVGAVKYGFFNGTEWCFSILLSSGMDCHGKAPTEFGDFDLQYAPAPWRAPVSASASRASSTTAQSLPLALSGSLPSKAS
jgi:hypothetical protein